MQLGTLWIIFSLSFVMAMSGAMMPGPLFTYTIAGTIQARRRGFLVGPKVIAGHAALEFLLLFGLVLGVAEFLKSPMVIKAIGVLGGLLLAWMGIGLIREALRTRKAPPAVVADGIQGGPQTGENGGLAGNAPGVKASTATRMSPVLAGVLLSMSNPYWWVWWVTVGSASLIRFGVSLDKWQGFIAFWVGHESGDLLWYTGISTLAYFGRRGLSAKLYAILLFVCGIVIIGFGAYLGISLFVRHG